MTQEVIAAAVIAAGGTAAIIAAFGKPKGDLDRSGTKPDKKKGRHKK